MHLKNGGKVLGSGTCGRRSRTVSLVGLSSDSHTCVCVCVTAIFLAFSLPLLLSLKLKQRLPFFFFNFFITLQERGALCGVQRAPFKTQLSPSNMRVLGIKLRTSGRVASVFTS